MTQPGDSLQVIPGSGAPAYKPRLETTFTHVMTVPSVLGQLNYLIPVGDYFLDAAGETILEIDMGAGFVTQVFGVDYDHFHRMAPATVIDAAIGFRYLAGAVPAGWTFRFTWLQRLVLLTPLGIGKIKLTGVGGSLDLAVTWGQNTANAPNGVTIPELTGYVAEFWRRTRRPGGIHSPVGVTNRRGPRYVPYYRGPAGQFDFHVDEFSMAGQRHRAKLRVCYYNTLTGARSEMSPDIIVVCSSFLPDQVNGRGSVRAARSVWIE